MNPNESHQDPITTDPLSDSTASPDPMAKTKAAGFGQFAQDVSRSRLFGTSSDLPRVIEVSLDQIDRNPDQPRKHFDGEKLRELASSIEKVGLIQPVTLARNGENYRLVAGERRFRAHELLGRETIAAIITDGEPDVIALIENVQREALDPFEEADAYAQLMERHGYSQAELGQVVGKRQNTVSEALSLCRLSPAVVERYRTSDAVLSKSALVEIAKETKEERQLELIEATIEGDLSVRAIREHRKAPPSPTRSDKPTSVVAANARKDRIIRSLHATAKRLASDAKAEDFPAGSEALERIKALREEINAHLDRITEQGRLTDE